MILAERQNIPNIIICINKADLSSEEEKQEFLSVYGKIYDVAFVSAKENIGFENLKDLIKGVTVFAGPSGVGKSSIINHLIPDSKRETGEISKKIERGKHTTRQVELLYMVDDKYIVDSPGFTSLSLDFLKPEDIQNYFREFEDYIGKCRFVDCAHIAEPDCAIKENIGKNISKERYERFVYLYNELKQRR